MQALQFNGKASEYFKIWITNILLTIITLGLYYPWAKVKTLKYFYGHTTIADRRFDYHANGKQLFRSYLIAASLLVIYQILSHFVPLASNLMFFALVTIFPWILWKSMQFRMQMTSFSEVRFSFDSELRHAYINFLLIPTLCIFSMLFFLAATIGGIVGLHNNTPAGPLMLSMMSLAAAIITILLGALIYAIIIKRQSMYQINGLSYGQDAFSVKLETKIYFTILLKTVGLAIACLTAYIMIAALALTISFGLQFTEIIQFVGNLNQLATNLLDYSLLIVALFYVSIIVVSFVVFAFLQAQLRNYLINQIRLGQGISMASTLSTRSLYWVMLSNFFAVSMSLGLALPWAKVRVARLLAHNTIIKGELDFDHYMNEQRNYQSSLGDQMSDVLDIDAGLII